MKALMLIGLLAVTPAAAGPKYLLPEPYTDENGAIIYPDPVIPGDPVPPPDPAPLPPVEPRYEPEYVPTPPPALYRDPYYQPRGLDVHEYRREERWHRRQRAFDAAHQILDIIERLAR